MASLSKYGLHGAPEKVLQKVDTDHHGFLLDVLLSNAVKYTEKGGVRLSFRMEGAGDNFVMIGVSVADTGIGIMPEDMSRLFTEFERLNPKKHAALRAPGWALPLPTECSP